MTKLKWGRMEVGRWGWLGWGKNGDNCTWTTIKKEKRMINYTVFIAENTFQDI